MDNYLSDYDKGFSKLMELEAWYRAHPGDRNEATTRLQLVNRLFFECLGWDPAEHVELEDEENKEYADYLFSTTKAVLIVEAKREGNSFEVPAGSAGIKYSIRSLMRDHPELKKALRQVAAYCWERGVPYAAVCNGYQVVAFVATRNDSVRPLEGDALVFPSLTFMMEHFLELWQAISKPGIMENKLQTRLVSGTVPDLPPKLSGSIMTYPGTKVRNIFQTDLMNLSELVIEDVTRAEDLEERFYRECYCSSQALSQYSQLSRDILAARYTALFDDKSPGPATVPISSTKGITPELLAESLARRPILLLGDVGVGKTSFQRHLITVDAESLLKDAISLYVNFGSRGTLSADLRRFLIGAIEDQLAEKYGIDILDRGLVKRVYAIELKKFERSIYGDLSETDPAAYADRQRAHLDQRLSDRSEHLRLSLAHLSKERRQQVVIFLDNTDQRSPEDQEQAFLIAQELAEGWRATVYLPIRPETFHRSKKIGALSGYHSKAFTISPPRVDDVLRKRLGFALKFTRGEIPLPLPITSKITTKMTALDSLIRVLLESFEDNADLLELLDNISSGNIRLVLDLVKQFLGSGHVNTQKICQRFRETGSYTVPLHEFLRAVMFGDNVFYDPSRSPFANIFDIAWNDPKEHFLVPIIVGTVHRLRSAGINNGFVDLQSTYARLQGLGFIPEQIDHAIGRSVAKNLLDTPARRVPIPGREMPQVLRATSIGLYHINRLSRLFSYHDAVLVDVPVLDPQVRKGIRVAINIDDRVQRVRVFKTYLDKCWEALPPCASFFNWPDASKDLEANTVRVLESDQKQERRRSGMKGEGKQKELGHP